jgi:PAS domain S-box-containing protein
VAQNLAAFDLSLGTIAGARLEALFEAVPLAVAVFDPELRMLTANARYRELTGVDAAAAVRISIYDAFPNALADLTEQIDSALRGEMPPGPVSIPFQQRDRRRLIETTFVPLTDESGGRGLLFAGNDVTEREELRETLSRNVAQLESIFDVIPDSVRVFDSEGRTVRSNTQALLDYASVDPPTLRELWQRDRPRTTDGTSLFMHEHPTARALRGERVRGETLSVRRGPGWLRADHRSKLEPAIRRAREDPWRRSRSSAMSR